MRGRDVDAKRFEDRLNAAYKENDELKAEVERARPELKFIVHYNGCDCERSTGMPPQPGEACWYCPAARALGIPVGEEGPCEGCPSCLPEPGNPL